MTDTDDTPDDLTRRRLLASAAVLGAGAVAGCGGSGDGGGDPTTSPEPTEETMAPTETATETTTEPMAAPDVPLLNYALTLEHLENAFYREGLAEFSDDELMNADVVTEFGDPVRTEIPDYVRTVGAHEAAHVEALTGTIEELGGDPVPEGEYDFGYATPSEFFGVAMALENTGVSAYAGAAPRIVDQDVLGAAAGIHSVEARHAGFLNLLNGKAPFPDAVDEARSVQEVLDIAGQFVTSEVDPSVYETAADRPAPGRKAADDTTDVNVLNFALTLEHLENAFYREGLERFSDQALMDADALSGYDGPVRSALPGHLERVQRHEAAHVTALSDTVERLGGDPVQEAEYDFGYETPSEFLGVARTLENTGVAAYKGAAPTVSNDDVFAAAIGIHSVEARHAALLNEVDAVSPFPDGVDQPRTMAEVRDAVSAFIVS